MTLQQLVREAYPDRRHEVRSAVPVPVREVAGVPCEPDRTYALVDSLTRLIRAVEHADLDPAQRCAIAEAKYAVAKATVTFPF